MRQYTDRELRHHAEVHRLEAAQLKLQAREYERRLTDLNHAHAKAEADKAEFVNKQVYTTELKDLRAQLDKIRENADMAANVAATGSKDIAALESTISWLSRVVVGALVAGIVGLLLKSTVGI